MHLLLPVRGSQHTVLKGCSMAYMFGLRLTDQRAQSDEASVTVVRSGRLAVQVNVDAKSGRHGVVRSHVAKHCSESATLCSPPRPCRILAPSYASSPSLCTSTYPIYFHILCSNAHTLHRSLDFAISVNHVFVRSLAPAVQHRLLEEHEAPLPPNCHGSRDIWMFLAIPSPVYN